MEIIPAIDIRDGRCVRLFQGDYARETVYAADPAQVARRWQAEGASRLHVVDLDGAAQGEPRNLLVVQDILREVRVPVQLGGGLRRRETVEEMLALGVERVVLGTAAVEEPELVRELCAQFGDRVIVGIDARGGRVATWGWKRESAMTAAELAQRLAELGARRLIYTDIGQDGTLTGPNFSAIADLMAQSPLPVIASGGVASVEHLVQLAELRVEGAIVGRALYTGDIRLPQALAQIQGVKQSAPQV